MVRVAGILLAAGAGTRLGMPKALVEIGGRTLAERGVAMLRAAGADPVLLVTGAAAIDVPGARTVHNPLWHTGMGSSLAAALQALASTELAGSSGGVAVTGTVIALADQPGVGAAAVRRLIDAHAAGARAAIASYDGTPLNPVLLARELWPEVAEAAAGGDTGARPFLQAHRDLVTLVDCTGTGDPSDVDTPQDLARARAVLSGT
jgi:CTP:molybdopterin cytidylyltransferase MocA